MAKNPGKYREMSIPHATAEAGTEAMRAFFQELAESREKHKIANVYVILMDNCLTDGGEEMEYINAYSFGDSLRAEAMTAYAYGEAKRRREEAIGTYLTGKAANLQRELEI